MLRALRVLRVLHCMCIPFRERLPLQPPLGTLARRNPFFFLSTVQRKIGATKKKCAKNFINNFITFPYFEIITHCLDSHAPSVFLFSHGRKEKLTVRNKLAESKQCRFFLNFSLAFPPAKLRNLEKRRARARARHFLNFWHAPSAENEYWKCVKSQ